MKRRETEWDARAIRMLVGFHAGAFYRSEARQRGRRRIAAHRPPRVACAVGLYPGGGVVCARTALCVSRYPEQLRKLRGKK